MKENYSHLVVPFDQFEYDVKNVLGRVKHLLDFPTDDDKLKEFIELKDKWLDDIKYLLTNSFADTSNVFGIQIKQAMRYNVISHVIWQTFKSHKDAINSISYQLKSIVKIISVCDFIREARPDDELLVNLSIKAKADLLLKKLYELGDDSNYGARLLLEGNGVVLNPENQAIDIAKYLERQGWATTLHYLGPTDILVSITTEGKIYYEEQSDNNSSINPKFGTNALSSFSKVFIVHGQNNEMKETVARVIDKLGFEAVILHEKANIGKTVIEKFSHYAGEVGYAIVLLSADDMAYPKTSTSKKAKLRPRQNVVFELGYFIAKLGRERVFALYETMDDFELHSDFAGVVLTHFDTNGGWKLALAKEFSALGVQIDLNKLHL